ncbi:MAG: HAMP domain-containing histidine kinase [Salibacteraceae bacterium]|nr:HAMP domain-containing histidine kinase [Salibacteraceae bacterium]
MRKSPKTILLLYVLLGYVVLQFMWWAYLIYDLNVELIDLKRQLVQSEIDSTRSDAVGRQLTMILGEGTVFLSLLLVGAFYIRKFILREQKLAKQERNFLLATTHEFNSPIAAIRLNLQTIAKRNLNDEQKAQIVSGAIGATHRLESLVSNLLIASRIDAGKFDVHNEEFELVELIHNVIGRLESLHISSGGTIVFEPEGLYNVSADKRAMELVFENLLSNAIKYATSSRISVELTSDNSALYIAVRDEGAGIPQDERNNIFKKFYRIENEETRSQKGTGLGLYLVKELVTAQNGVIAYKPNKPRGSVFEIRFETKL